MRFCLMFDHKSYIDKFIKKVFKYLSCQGDMKMRLMFIAFVVFVLNGCAGVDVKQYEKNTPRFDLYQYFQGATTGWGIVFDRRGGSRANLW